MSAELRAEIKQMIVDRLFLARKGITPDDIDDEADLGEAYNIDSVEMFEIVVGVEEDYGVAVPEEEFSLDLFRSVAKIEDLVLANG